MAKLKTFIQLHSICITSLTNPHADLPGDMKMFAQLIVEDNIFLQALPVASEDNQMSWKLGFGCKIPPHASTFSVTILRESETEGTRLLGYVEIGRGEVVESVESKKSFQLKCNKVNPDGPSLNFNAGFSVSQLPYHEVSGLDLSGMPEDTIASTKVHKIRSELQKMYEDSRKAQFSMDALQRWVMHERILLCLQSNDGRARWLNIFGDILLQSYQATGHVGDLNQGVCAYRDAVRDDPGSISHLTDLGRSLQHHFKQFGSLVDINQSVVMLEAAVERTLEVDLQKHSRLNDLGMSLLIRFQRLGGLDDLNQSVLRFEAAGTLTPDGHPNKPAMLNNLGNSLFRRFERLGDLSDLNKSIIMFEDAVRLTPDGHPDKPGWLNNLGTSLLGRFERLGDLSDLNKSIMMKEDAVRLTPDGHPDKPARLNNLGSSLLGRFERLSDLSDLNKSIMMKEDAVRLTPDGHPDKPAMLNNLGSSLLGHFERLGDLSDLNKSIMMKEDAVRLTPDGHPDKPGWLNNLGTSLLGRFERLGDLSNLNKSIMMFEDAVQLTPDGHPDKPGCLNNLGSSVISVTSTNGHPDKPGWLNNFGLSLSGRFEQLHDPHSSILHAYTTAIKLIPEMAWLGLSITDRHHLLSQAGQVVRDAASAAIAVHDYEKAVEWLDQGRSVIWGQLLNLRTPVDELRKSHPDLADTLLSLSASLETAGTRSNAVTDGIEPQSLDSIVRQYHDLALERNEVLQQIRELPGFERFLLSKPIAELSHAAKIGPVAMLNISAYGCDALILMPGLGDEVIHISLSDFTIHEAQAFAKVLVSIVGTPGRSDRLFGFQEGHMAPDDIFCYILSVLWLKILHPILKALAITTPVRQDLGRIWWCPTGPLAFLPIHAAGVYELQILVVTQPSAKGQSYLPGTQEEIKCIQQHARGKAHLQWLDEEMATIDKVQKGMTNSRWVHFACHGVQSDSPTESALLLAGSSQLTLSNIIQLSLPNADLAFLSACQTATGSQELQDESVHLTAGMLLAGYRGVIGTMWSIMDSDAPQVASDVYAHLLAASPADPTRAAQALHLAVQRLREQPGAEKEFLRWSISIWIGRLSISTGSENQLASSPKHNSVNSLEPEFTQSPDLLCEHCKKSIIPGTCMRSPIGTGAGNGYQQVLHSSPSYVLLDPSPPVIDESTAIHSPS
ncbi:CHAT domain-containing protein [Mycena rebaudengoi]|nr:CHAT domain-containing protein [Mycena rebaudengoi]